jgi:CheY-like chemotaxis protein
MPHFSARASCEKPCSLRIARMAPPNATWAGGENEALAAELALDGYDVRLVSDLAMIGGVDLVIFAHAPQRGEGLAALRGARWGALAGSAARVLWISTSGHALDALRAFDAGADDVLRAPFLHAELVAGLGQAEQLAEFLDLHALPWDLPIPFVWLTEASHPPTEHRIDRERDPASGAGNPCSSQVGVCRMSGARLLPAQTGTATVAVLRLSRAASLGLDRVQPIGSVMGLRCSLWVADVSRPRCAARRDWSTWW